MELKFLFTSIGLNASGPEGIQIRGMTICDRGGGERDWLIFKKLSFKMSPKNSSLRLLMPPNKTLPDLMMPCPWRNFFKRYFNTFRKGIKPIIRGMHAQIKRNYNA